MATTEPVQREASPARELAVAIIGAVCGAVVTYLFNWTDATKVIGIALGAGIPPFVTTVGKWRHIRATAAMSVAVIALVLTYAGGLVVNEVSEVQIVPPLGAAPTTSTPTTTTVPPTTTRTPPVVGLGIEVTPTVLTCKPKCDSKVTIKSTGTETLAVTSIVFDGPARAHFKQSGGCAPRELNLDETCIVEVFFSPAATGSKETAQLVINQNLPGDATYVALTGEGPSPSLDLDASSSGVNCVYRPTGASDGRDAIDISFHLLLTGATPGKLPGPVPVSGRSDSGSSTSLVAAASTDPQAFVVVTLPLRPVDYKRQHTISVAVDPDGKIAEANEKNNQFQVKLTVPPLASKPTSATTLKCPVA